MKSLLLLLLLPLLVFADSESEESGEEELTTTQYICGLVLDDDREEKCNSCARKALTEADITETEEQAKYEAEATTILHSCSDHIPIEAESCVNELNSISCLDLQLQTKEIMSLAVVMRNAAKSKPECLQCVTSAFLEELKSSTQKGIKSIRRRQIGQNAAFEVVFQCLRHFMPQDLDEILSSESSE